MPITSQDAVLYPSGKDGVSFLKLPLTKKRLKVAVPESGVLKEAKIRPVHGRFIVSLTIEAPEDAVLPFCGKNLAAVDPGVENIAAIVCTDGNSVLYKGGAILAWNRYFAKERARAVGILTKGHNPKTVKKTFAYLDRLSARHDHFVKDQLHKISRSIVDFCILYDVGILVLGTDRGWKQNVHLGKANNQNFVQMPFSRLCEMIMYKARMAGIRVISQEESYTSKASFIDGDRMPVYGTDDADVSFGGKRITRGLYRAGDRSVINADLNGISLFLL